MKLTRRSLDDNTQEFLVELDPPQSRAALGASVAASLALSCGAWLTALSTALKVLITLVCLGRCVLQLMEVKSESIKVLKHVGVTLESTRQCGLVSSTFIDIERIRAVIINEAITTTCIRFYLAFILYKSDSMAVAFPNLMPRIHILQPVYQQVQALISDNPSAQAGGAADGS